MVATERNGAYLRYYGMRPRIFTHFGMRERNSINLKEINDSVVMNNFLTLHEEVRKASF